MSRAATLTLNPSVDESTSADRVSPEQKTRCAHPRYDPGGGGINVSRAMRHLGCETPALFAGGGVTGRMLAALLEAEGTPHDGQELLALDRFLLDQHVDEPVHRSPMLVQDDLSAVEVAIDDGPDLVVDGLGHLFGVVPILHDFCHYQSKRSAG